MDIIDKSGNNLDYYKVVNQLTQAITQLNTNHKIDVHNVYGSIDRPTKGIGYNDVQSTDKKLITIQNPEGLNTGDNPINDEWGITYGGRDLTLDVDNYGWVVRNRMTGKSGYYIVERELIEGSWLNVRWGVDGVTPKERKEVIDKKRLRDKGMIQRDMIVAILNTKSERN